jgi:hypothetical protein
MSIKRREFLKAGAATATVAGAAGVGGLAGSACAGLFDGKLFEGAELPLPDMDEYIRKVDDGMKRIAEWDRRDDIPETELDKALENDLGKKALRALYMAGMFGDLPDAGQVHPGMQARIERSLPEMDEAVDAMVEYLSGLSDGDLQLAQEFLRDKTNPGMEIGQWFDEVESALGVSGRRRAQTRAFVTQIVTRMRNQPPRTVIDDFVGKVEKTRARSGSAEEVERQMIARVGKEAFFARQERLAMYSAAWAQEGVTAEDVPVEELPPVELPPPEEFPEPEEADAGVPQDAGPIQQKAPPASMKPEQPSSHDESASPEDWSKTSCQRLKDEMKALVAERHQGNISQVAYKLKYDDLRFQMVGAGCVDSKKPDYGRRGKDELTPRQRKKKLLRTGAICLGVGVLLSGLAIVLVVTGDVGAIIAGAVLATPGAILLLIGLFMLPIAAIKYRDV